MPFDYILAFASQAAAQADPIVGAYWIAPSAMTPSGWQGDCCTPGLAVTTKGSGGEINATMPDGSTQTQPGPDLPYDNLWRINIRTRERNAALEGSPALEVAADYGAFTSGVAFPGYLLPCTVFPAASMGALGVSPQIAGAAYVYGTS